MLDSEIPIIGGAKAPVKPVYRNRPTGPIIVKQKQSTSAASFKYENPDLDDEPTDDKHLMQDLSMSKRIAEWKEREFPGHPFEFEVDSGQGVVLVSLPALMGPINRYTVHITDLYGDPGFRRLREACGHILERYKISRTGYSRDDFAAAVSAAPVIFRRHEDVPE